MKKYGFTLAEVLITLLIIGVVAALTIPSVISNYQQQEFKTGLKKAVSVLNEAIQTNIAQDGETPYEIDDLFSYLQRHMSVIKSGRYSNLKDANLYFYTVDGMRFEKTCGGKHIGRLHEDNNIQVSMTNVCGSYGLNNNKNNTQAPPCIILVDVNGDKKPNPVFEGKLNENFGNMEYFANYSYPSPSDKRFTDVFSIMITEDRAIPFGVVAQRAMYSK